MEKETIFVHTHKSELRFGKHKGKSVETVLVDDAQWLQWAVQKIPTFKVSEPLSKDIEACAKITERSKKKRNE